MAQKVQVLLVCDLHDGDVEGEETLTFALDGGSYEIDLCEDHAAELRDAMAPYVGAARRSGRSAGTSQRRSSGGGTPRARRASSGDRDLADVRTWARANGHEVNDRGRIPNAVLEAYDAAH